VTDHDDGDQIDESEPDATTTVDLAIAYADAVAELDELRTSHGMQALHEQWDPSPRPVGRPASPPPDATPGD